LNLVLLLDVFEFIPMRVGHGMDAGKPVDLSVEVDVCDLHPALLFALRLGLHSLGRLMCLNKSLGAH
jgi:hypothetical protein